MPRVAPITGKSDVPAEYHAVVDEVVKVFGQVRGPFSMLLHSPKLAERVLNLGNFFRNDSIVEGKDRSLAILAAACYYGFLSGVVSAFEVAAPPDGDPLPR